MNRCSKRTLLFFSSVLFLSGCYLVQTTPDAPLELSATAVSAHEIKLDWRDFSSNEAGFKLERKREGEEEFSLIAELKFRGPRVEFPRYRGHIYQLKDSFFMGYPDTTLVSKTPPRPSMGHVFSLVIHLLACHLWGLFHSYSSGIRHRKIEIPALGEQRCK